MGMTIDECRTCKHAFTTGKDRWYCKKSLADKDDCGEYEMTIEEVNEKLYDIKTDAIYQITSEEKEAIDTAISIMRKYQRIQKIVEAWRENGLDYDSCDAMENIERVVEDGNVD